MKDFERESLAGALDTPEGPPWLLANGIGRWIKMKLGSEGPMEQAVAAWRAEVMERLFMDLQTAYFNVLYYRTRASSTKSRITAFQVIGALSASAAFTGLLRTWAPWLLVVLTGVAAIAAAIGPVLGLASKYAQFEKAALGHAIIKDRILALLRDLKISEITDGHEAREREICAFRDSLSALDEKPDDSVRESCWDKVEREYPAAKSWEMV